MNPDTMPRGEYPRPQFAREQWLCLNGTWEFEFDNGDSGFERSFPHIGLTEAQIAALRPAPKKTASGTLVEAPKVPRGSAANTLTEFSERIIVPFCPESKLSGLEHTDFLHAVWYRRVVTIPSEWKGKRVLLHFGAVDYDATVWINGREVARHRGGFTPFTCDLMGHADGGDTVIVCVRARDDHRVARARGKQGDKYAPYACLYTRTTGIWQTVWMEPVPMQSALKRPRLTPDVANSLIRLEQPLMGTNQNAPGLTLRATLSDADGTITTTTVRADQDMAPHLDLHIPSARRRLWSVNDPHLYDVKIELLDARGKVVDSATSYAGLRSVTLDGKKVRINGKPVFQRLILDQGYWPESVMTAPTDAELIADIQRSQAAGFNGARLHQKVFEERFLYHADRLGYLVWGEFGDWGCGGFGPTLDHQQPGATYITQFLEALERDYSHPSIVGWCPLNETWQEIGDKIVVLDDVTRGMFLACKAMDTSRPVLDTSGYAHRVLESDIYDSHDYEQDPKKFKLQHRGLAKGAPFINTTGDNRQTNVPYRGQPYFVSEFGGIWWNPEAFNNKESWGYGKRVKSIEEWYERFEGLCHTLLDDPNMFGYCYTQLTDVYPEENGLYTFDRKEKFDNARLKAVQDRIAAIEKE